MVMIDQQQQNTIDSIVRILHNCQSILFVTGAGISADSGMPTYRGIGGLYDVGTTEEGFPIEEVLSGSMFRSNPELTWKYLLQISNAARGANYNRAHEVIVEMERHFPRVWTLTQNVDGFHRTAGSQNLIEIHGNMHSLSCTKCGSSRVVANDGDPETVPYCPECQSIMRPDVVLFEESLPEESSNQLRHEMRKGFGAIFSIGTSSVFPYIQWPILDAKENGTPTIEINPSETSLSHRVDYRLALGATSALDKNWTRFLQET